MNYVTVGKENNEEIKIHYKDWGVGEPILFCHGWPLSSDAWEDQMLFLAEQGYRCIAHDRRGHGRSSQSWEGNDMDSYADDLAKIIEKLGLKDITLVGHAIGGGEIARYIGRHGTKHITRAVLIGTVTPIILKTDSHPEGLPLKVFDDLRASVLKDRSQFFHDLSAPFYGANRPGSTISQGVRDSFWLQGMQAGLKAVYDSIKAFTESDFTEDLKKFTIPTLILHGSDDRIAPIEATGKITAKIIRDAQLKVYEEAPHGMCSTHKDQINKDLLAFIKETNPIKAK